VLVLSFREALGGKWLTKPLGWLILLAPVTLLVTLQESGTPFPFWGLVLLSALAQQIAGPLVGAAIAALGRRRWAIIPLPLTFIIWGIIGLVRGVVAGLFASIFAGVDPGFAYRIVSWIAISLIWGPLFTYSMAQLDHRRALLDEWSRVSAQLESEQSVAGKSADQLRKQLIATMQHTVGPVLDDIRASLVAVSGGIGATSLSSIRFKLALVGREVGLVLDPTLEQEVPRNRTRLAHFSDAVQIEQSHPILLSLLTGLGLAPLVIPDAIRLEGWAFGAEVTIALLVAFVVMTVSLTTIRWWRVHSRAHPIVVSTIGFFLSGASASGTMIVLHWAPFQPHELALIFALPVGVALTLLCESGAIGLSLANADLSRKIVDATAESAVLHKRSEATVQRVTTQLTELMHGPIQGRLSACAMALNFHAASADPMDPDRIATVTAAVLNHLTLASRDLEALGKA
jgi:hypothetical protein